jgi:hypothetical protein
MKCRHKQIDTPESARQALCFPAVPKSPSTGMRRVLTPPLALMMAVALVLGWPAATWGEERVAADWRARALRVLQQADVALALVHDEYGHLEGIVTPADLLSAIAGTFVSHADDGDGPMVTEREDGSLLLSGALPADALADRLGMELPDDRDYATAAGYVLSVLKRLPNEGEHFHEQGWRFEVVDMDGRKIDKLLVERKRKAVPVEEQAEGF